MAAAVTYEQLTDLKRDIMKHVDDGFAQLRTAMENGSAKTSHQVADLYDKNRDMTDKIHAIELEIKDSQIAHLKALADLKEQSDKALNAATSRIAKETAERIEKTEKQNEQQQKYIDEQRTIAEQKARDDEAKEKKNNVKFLVYGLVITLFCGGLAFVASAIFR